MTRPIDTTAHPKWWQAREAMGLIPRTSDPAGRGARMVAVVGQFLLTQGEYAGRRLCEVMLPWQDALVRFLFGFTDTTGRRRIRRAFLKIGKGTSKSTLAAALALAFLMDCVDRGVGFRGLIVIMSPSVATSNIVFGHIEQAILNDPHLRHAFRSKSIQRTIVHVASGIEIVVKVASLEQSVGLRPLLVIYDELHLMALECRQAGQVMDQLRRGQANAGDEALEITITTAPPATASGVYSSALSYARKVRDGDIQDDTFLPILFEPPLTQFPDLDLGDPEAWFWGMPSLKRSVDEVGTLHAAELLREYDEAMRGDEPQAMGLFLSQRLGVEPAERRGVGALLFQERWGSMPGCPSWPPPEADFVACSYDPGGVDDPFAVAWCWKDGQGRYCFAVHQHLVRVGYERAGSALRMLYDEAIGAGELTVHATTEALFGALFVEARALELQSGRHSVVFGGDVHGVAGFVPQFRQGTSFDYEPVKQGWPLLAAVHYLEGLAADGRVAHAATPLLAANVANLVLEEGSAIGGRHFAKRGTDSTGTGPLKIDGAMAVLSALSLHEVNAYNQVDVSALIG
ncbi:MAG TPA: terminase large subunit [Lysobacter sp.]